MQDRPFTDQQQREVNEYIELSTPEERLTWLMERPHLHAEVPAGRCTSERRVPGCLSGLWLEGEVIAGACHFSARSDSSMVQGIVSFLCDLYSDRSAEEVIEIGASLADDLGLERLLSLTRKRAVASAISFFVATARAGAPRVVGM